MTPPGPALRAAAGDPVIRATEGDPVIRAAEGDDDMETVRELFEEYQEAIGVDLCFQGFEEEMAARRAGHKTLCLDTLDFMAEARKLYRSLGFVEIPAYYDNPMEGVLYMELAL